MMISPANFEQKLNQAQSNPSEFGAFVWLMPQTRGKVQEKQMYHKIGSLCQKSVKIQETEAMGKPKVCEKDP
jgi:hypothetical protein